MLTLFNQFIHKDEGVQDAVSLFCVNVLKFDID